MLKLEIISVVESIAREGTYEFFFFSSRRRHTRSLRDWSSDVCSSVLLAEGPDCMFARRAAAEVLPGEEDARAPGAGVVQLEVRVRTTVGPEAPVVEQGGPEPGAFHTLEELLRNDLVGIHVGARQSRQPTGMTHEGLHHGPAPPAPPPPPLPTSPMSPPPAAAPGPANARGGESGGGSRREAVRAGH